jgi:enolase
MLRAPGKIERVVGRSVWDSRGRPTVEAEVFLDNGARGRAIAPAGASTGTNEAVELRDGGKPFGGFGVTRAVENVNTEIASALRGMPIADQAKIDRRMIELDGTPNKARLGANATVAVSMAALHAAAASSAEPLWRYLIRTSHAPHDPHASHASYDPHATHVPMPMIQIFGGGAHAGFRIDIQDFLIIPVGASTFAEAMSMTATVYQAAGRIMRDRGQLHGVADEGGWWPAFASNTEALDTLVEAIERAELRPGTDVAIAIDVAASQLRRGGKYHLAAEGADLETEQLIELFVGWCDRYPIISIEDPLAEDDHEGMRSVTAKLGGRIQIIGDDYLVTSADRVKAASSSGACNAVLIKPNQVGTITETFAAVTAARDAGWSAIVSARSGETEDVTIAHLAVGWGVGQLKVGSIARSERTAKWNEVLRIEEALGPSAVFSRGPRV